MIDVAPLHMEIIRGILKKYVPDYEVRAFGSRVRGRARTYSDLPFRVEIMDWKAISAESRLEVILLADDLLAALALQIFAGVSSDRAAVHGRLLVRLKPLGVTGPGDFCGRSLAQHRKDQLQVGHMVSQIFPFQPFIFLILRRCHPESSFGYFGG
jgi:predicted nucleotidyltransferase